MMKNNLRFLLLFVVFGLSSVLYGQRRPCAVPTVTLIPTVTHATCFDMVGDISFSITAPDGAYVHSLKLIDEQGGTAYDHGDGSLSGIATGLSVGMYRFSGSVVVEYECDGLGYITSVEIDQNVWLGIETVWTEKTDMVSFPNSYSAKRNATTTTYGGVRSSNGITSGDGWIELSAVYGNTTNNRVYLLIGETNTLGGFSPSSDLQYIEFYEGSGGNGIQLKYETSTAGTYATTSISTNQDDKIRLVRTGSTLTIQKGSSSSTVFTLPQSYSGPMNIAVRTLAVDDGCLDVVSTFDCRSEIYAKLDRKLRGVRYSATGNMLKFYVAEEYDDQTNTLDYQVYKEDDRTISFLSGTQIKSVAHGDNRFDLDVSSLTAGAYILEVTNKKKEKFYLRFLKK